VLAGLGVAAGERPGERAGTWRGRPLRASAVAGGQRQVTPLAPGPLANGSMARALGRGDLIAELYQLRAMAHEDRLEAEVAAGLGAKALRRSLDRLVALAAALEQLPRAEAMARWFLELSDGSSREAALARLIAAFPYAPETLDACRAERDQPRDVRAAALARAHLDRAAAAAGRAVPGDI
jgi:hypothetical protein